MDEVAMKTEMLEQVSPQLEGHGDFDRLYQESMKLGDTALEKDDFNRARSLYRLAMSAARRQQEGRGGGSHVRTVNVRGTPNSRGATTWSTKVDDQENVVTARENRLRDTRQAYARVSSQLHTLLRDANDPLANSAVGQG